MIIYIYIIYIILFLTKLYCHSRAPFNHSYTNAITRTKVNQIKINNEVQVKILKAIAHGNKNIISKSKTINSIANK